MCRELDALSKAVAAFAKGFDAHALSPAQAGTVMRACARMEASLASVKALAAARHSDCDAWKFEGFRSPSDQLATHTGMTPSHARRLLDTGRRLAAQPDVAHAALAGDLSIEQAGLVSEAAAAAPARTHELIERARRCTMSDLQEEVTRIRAANCDLEARRRAIHAKRSFRRWTDSDGAFNARIYGLPEDGALLFQALDPIRRRLIIKHREERPDQPNEPLDALDYDAALVLAATAVGAPAELSPEQLGELDLFPHAADPPGAPTNSEPDLFTPTGADSSGPAADQGASPPTRRRRRRLAGGSYKVIVRVDYDALIRGFAVDGETCDMTGSGPVAVSTVAKIIETTNPFIAAVLIRNKKLEGVYHHGRKATSHQQTALEFFYPTCAAAGCHAHLGLQNDHRVDWARTHHTLLAELDRLCPHHHNLKTRNSWALIPGTGKRPLVPPTDPRHPNHRPASPTGDSPPRSGPRPATALSERTHRARQ